MTDRYYNLASIWNTTCSKGFAILEAVTSEESDDYDNGRALFGIAWQKDDKELWIDLLWFTFKIL